MSSKKIFIEYLKERLIPDLLESGKEATAEDFEEAIHWMTTPHPNCPVCMDAIKKYDEYEQAMDVLWKTSNGTASMDQQTAEILLRHIEKLERSGKDGV